MGQSAPLERRLNKLFISRLLRQDHRGSRVGKTRYGSHKLAQLWGNAAEPQGDQNHCSSESLRKDSATKMEVLVDAPQQTDGAGELATQWGLKFSRAHWSLFCDIYGEGVFFLPFSKYSPLFTTHPTNSVTFWVDHSLLGNLKHRGMHFNFQINSAESSTEYLKSKYILIF